MIVDSFDNYRIILASQSPRRQQLLRELGLKFDIVIKDYSESYPEDLKGGQIAEYISAEKAKTKRYIGYFYPASEKSKAIALKNNWAMNPPL